MAPLFIYLSMKMIAVVLIDSVSDKDLHMKNKKTNKPYRSR